MRPRSRITATVAAALVCAAATGCGLGAGEESEGKASLRVTSGFGAERVLAVESENPAESLTVMRLLDSEAEIETLYGGEFVDSIEGITGRSSGSRRFDWFFFVNGVESSVGAAEVPVLPGDRIWWDYRDWTAALGVPAVVGSFPEPFLHGIGGRLPEIALICAEEGEACEIVARALDDAGIEAPPPRIGLPMDGRSGEGDALRVLVGEWEAIRADPVARTIERGPATSGVYAIPRTSGGESEIALLDPSGEEVAAASGGAGLIAATRQGDEPPTWVIGGTDEEGLLAAAGLLGEETLADHYALVVRAGDALVPVPVAEEPPPEGE